MCEENLSHALGSQLKMNNSCSRLQTADHNHSVDAVDCPCGTVFVIFVLDHYLYFCNYHVYVL